MVLVCVSRPAARRRLIAAMMRFHEDADGNFVQQFQTTAFDPRIWELYLFAAFTELGYAGQPNIAVPDFVLAGPRGTLAVEATTINPPQRGTVPQPKTDREIRAFVDNYVQIKLARALTRKLNHQPPYWAMPGVADIPFVLALQDFHAPGAMSRIVMPATEYVFGVRHSIVDGQRRIERLGEHVYGRNREPSHFFSLQGAENVSAVMLNPLGTITKFNRMGYIAGFGDRRVKMVRSGLRRGELDEDGPAPKAFRQEVQAPDYRETWIEGAVILHNPNARVPLDPDLIPDVNHEFLQPDVSIMSLLPPFQPYISHTSVTLSD